MGIPPIPKPIPIQEFEAKPGSNIKQRPRIIQLVEQEDANIAGEMFKEVRWNYKEWDYIQLPKTKKKELTADVRKILAKAYDQRKDCFTP